MAEKSNSTTAASFNRRSHGMDEAMKAGIGATVCSMLILTVVDAHAAGQHRICASFWMVSVGALIAPGHRGDDRAESRKAQ